jgi:hypothetical protein
MWYFEKGARCGWSRNPISKNLKNYDAKFGKEKPDKKTSYFRRQHLKNIMMQSLGKKGKTKPHI